jgi:hypothetical protein
LLDVETRLEARILANAATNQRKWRSRHDA